jgi:hypothetical protein
MSRERVINIYQDVLERKIYRFPNNFFLDKDGKKYLRYMTCYLLEERLLIPVHEIPLKVKASTLWYHRLRPPAQIFGWNYFDVIDNAYPGQFRPWEFKQVPSRYWYGEEGKNRAIKAVKYVIEEELKIPMEEIPFQVDFHFFKKYSLRGVFNLFGDSPFQVIEAVYPGVFHPWQFVNVPLNSWTNQVYIQETMEWFLFQQLDFSSYEEALMKLKKQHFFDFRLTGIYQRAFDSKLENVRKWIKQRNRYISVANSKGKIFKSYSK